MLSNLERRLESAEWFAIMTATYAPGMKKEVNLRVKGRWGFSNVNHFKHFTLYLVHTL